MWTGTRISTPSLQDGDFCMNHSIDAAPLIRVVEAFPLYIPAMMKVFLIAMPLFVLLTVGIAFVAEVRAGGEGMFMIPVFLLFFGFVLYKFAAIPYRIELLDGGHIRFVSLVRKTTMSATEIESVKPAPNMGFFKVRHSGGSLDIWNQFDGGHRFFTLLKEMNSGVELRGC